MSVVLRTVFSCLFFFFFFFIAVSGKKQSPRNPSCDIIMTPYSSWTSLNSLPRKGQTEVIHRYLSTSLLHPFWGKGITFLDAIFTNVCGQNVHVSNTAAVHEIKKTQQIHNGSDLFLKPTLFGQLILQFLSVRETHTLLKVHIMNETKSSSSRRKPAGEQLRKEKLQSETMYSAPDSLGTRQKMKSCLIANISLIH